MKNILETETNEVNDSLTEEESKPPKVVTGWTKLDNRLFWQGRYLTANAKWVYATLRSFTNNDTGDTFPSYDAIIERSGLSRPKVAEGLRELEEFHWIGKNKRFSKSTDYTVSYPYYYDSRNGQLLPDEAAPTKEEATAWASKLREERKMKDERRKTKRGWQEAREAIERKRAAEKEEEDEEIPF